jgi:hypothetical protein
MTCGYPPLVLTGRGGRSDGASRRHSDDIVVHALPAAS